MTTPRRRRRTPDPLPVPAAVAILLTFVVFFLVMYMTIMFDASSPTANGERRRDKYNRRKNVRTANRAIEHPDETLLDPITSRRIPTRLQALRKARQIVGGRLTDVQAGTDTVPELLLRGSIANTQKSPMKLSEIKDYLENWLHSLHATLEESNHATAEGIWQAYHDLAVQTLYVWDRDYLARMPERKNDNSIFLSVATYRDENCINTLNWAYEKATYPSKLFVGIVQQNCHNDCKSGASDEGEVEDVDPDEDCYEAFCEGPMNAYCNNVRVLDVDEPESMGPYAARYLASKLWYGEQWFMQIDAHMTFAQDWDASSLKMLRDAPSEKPVISHYPPDYDVDLDAIKDQPGARLCGPIFATSDGEAQIIRLEGGSDYDTVRLNIPRFAPFTAAGYFIAPSDFLREIPFDPFLPWIFMGEEIILSTRFWTSGYDIFSPTYSVVGHMYGRENKPGFWESVHRAFHADVHDALQTLVLDRIKYQLGYPEAARDMLSAKSLLTAIDQYSMGAARPLSKYLELVGLDMTTKEVTFTRWCEYGKLPPGFEHLVHLYEAYQ